MIRYPSSLTLGLHNHDGYLRPPRRRMTVRRPCRPRTPRLPVNMLLSSDSVTLIEKRICPPVSQRRLQISLALLPLLVSGSGFLNLLCLSAEIEKPGSWTDHGGIDGRSPTVYVRWRPATADVGFPDRCPPARRLWGGWCGRSRRPRAPLSLQLVLIALYLCDTPLNKLKEANCGPVSQTRVCEPLSQGDSSTRTAPELTRI